MTVVAQEHRLPSARFSFQKTPFCFWSPDAQADEYEALVYPTKGTITAFLSTKGYGRPKEVDVATRIWGKNVFDIPLPAFLELFKVRDRLDDPLIPCRPIVPLGRSSGSLTTMLPTTQKAMRL